MFTTTVSGNFFKPYWRHKPYWRQLEVGAFGADQRGRSDGGDDMKFFMRSIAIAATVMGLSFTPAHAELDPATQAAVEEIMNGPADEIGAKLEALVAQNPALAADVAAFAFDVAPNLVSIIATSVTAGAPDAATAVFDALAAKAPDQVTTIAAAVTKAAPQARVAIEARAAQVLAQTSPAAGNQGANPPIDKETSSKDITTLAANENTISQSQ
ncbi:MAG: hypothetical protein AB1781_05000 [Pseudomonadota bacterium]